MWSATMATPSVAAQAYANLARIADPTGPAKVIGEAGAGPNFSALLKDAVGALNAAARNSDGQTQAMAAGKANIVDVVTAVAETEVTIDALVSVRDKVIAAYEEIMRMPI
jgi:flagellar hook-basal body complex protein FliE